MIPYTPPQLPSVVCIEVAWEVIQTPVLERREKKKVLWNLQRMCSEVIIPSDWDQSRWGQSSVFSWLNH